MSLARVSPPLKRAKKIKTANFFIAGSFLWRPSRQDARLTAFLMVGGKEPKAYCRGGQFWCRSRDCTEGRYGEGRTGQRLGDGRALSGFAFSTPRQQPRPKAPWRGAKARIPASEKPSPGPDRRRPSWRRLDTGCAAQNAGPCAADRRSGRAVAPEKAARACAKSVSATRPRGSRGCFRRSSLAACCREARKSPRRWRVCAAKSG